MKSKPITIIGGGLSGLALGIGLRQRGVPVTVFEAGHYPRHRVCGEFISGRGQNSLARLGLLEPLQKVGVGSAESVAFFTEKKSTPTRLLPQSALCISRFVLDAWLAEKFKQLEGDLRQGERWRGEFDEGIVRASGRRAQPVADGWRLFGLKVHARGVALESDLEMHFIPSGYVGLCRLPGGEVNVCGLLRSKTTLPGLARDWRNWLTGSENSRLHQRLANADFDESSFCSVAGISLRPRQGKQSGETCIGDSLTMIPPVTGNGMSMAFESAELAIEPLLKYSRNEITWAVAQQCITKSLDARFSRRLYFSAWLQRLLFERTAQSPLLFAVRWEWCWNQMFKLTR